MIPEQWQKAKELFDAALKYPAAERQRFLDENCDGDEVVRLEVESLISNSEGAANFLEQPAVGAVAEEIDNSQKLIAGQNLNHYTIVKSLGIGGMGEVYLAEDTRLRRPVALKLLSVYAHGNQEYLQRFLREAQSASALNHPHICTIYEINNEGETPFIAMEYITGETLNEKIRKRLKESEILDISLQVADALVEAHAQGFVHRDIKPANIVITHRGQAKVLDFGLAKKIVADSEDETQKVITQPGVIIGTASYMSPEQARGGQLDTRSDIFSFGVVMYEMIAGKPPFEGENMVDVISSILRKEPEHLHRIAPGVSPDLERIVNKALRKDREERYQTVKDLLVDLRDIKQEMEFRKKLLRTETMPLDGADAKSESIGSRRIEQEDDLQNQSKLRILRPLVIFGTLLLGSCLIGLFIFWGKDNTVAGEPLKTIAILPFKPLAAEKRDDALEMGMAEALISRLSGSEQISVSPLSSVRKYAALEQDPLTAGRELGAEAVLDGSIQTSGDRVRMSVKLIKVSDGRQLWAEQFDEKLTDIFDLQDSISERVAAALRARLAVAGKKRYTQSTDAYQMYVKGRFHLLKGTMADTEKSISFFRQAIEADPTYALAYAGLSDAYRGRAVGGEMPPVEFMPKAKTTAQKAIELDDQLAEGHANLGHAYFWYDWDWISSETQHKRALELDPNNADTLQFYAHLLTANGRFAEALDNIKRAREIDPVNLRVNAIEGMLLFYAGRNDEAITRLQANLQLDSNYRLTNMFLARAYTEKGMFAEAIESTNKVRKIAPLASEPVAYGAYALARSGRTAEAKQALDELLSWSKTRWVSPYNIALAYNAVGQREMALESLERAIKERDVRMVFLRVEPNWHNLRNEPRFIELLRKMNFN